VPSVPMFETANVTLDINGNGVAKVGPISSREIWNPATVHVSVTTNVNEASCTISVGSSVRPDTFRDETFSGSSGDSSDRVENDVVKSGAYVFATWAGGDAGSQATMNVMGTKTV